MRAAVLKELNTFPEICDWNIDPCPSDEVEVRIIASALNHRDVWIMKGMYPNIKTPIILGSDGVGYFDDQRVIINPGQDWGKNAAVQDDAFTVLGMPRNGTFAERIQIPKQYIYPAPDHLSDAEAAALPLAGVTAYRTLFSRCQASPNDRVLVTGIGGGVAQFAMQFALAHGCEVVVTSGSDKKLEHAQSMGVHGGVNYRKESWAKELKAFGGFDVIIDSAGGDSFAEYVKVTRPGARIGFYGATRGKYNNINPQILFWRQVSILGSTMGSDQDFRDMLDFVEEHSIHPVIDTVFSLDNIADAMKRMEAGEQLGKIVLNHEA